MKFSDYKGADGGSEKSGKTHKSDRIDPKLSKTLLDMLGKYEGRSQEELVGQILSVAEKQRKAGKLSDADIDGFFGMLAPLVDEKKRKTLEDIVEKIKAIN